MKTKIVNASPRKNWDREISYDSIRIYSRKTSDKEYSYMAGDIKSNITTHIATLSTNPKTSWTKELNLVSWNDRDPRFDIRDWSPDHTKMWKGVTMPEEELKQ